MAKKPRKRQYAFNIGDPTHLPRYKPFQGELMHCLICGEEEQSSPGKETQWRAIEWGNRLFYFCPDEFPPDDASSTEFERAYIRAFAHIQIKVSQRLN
jgi:hypothetical protein